jgi:IS30 family transposase
MRPKFRHLTLYDRIEIQKQFPATKQAVIARSLGVSKSAISREIRAHSLNGRYDAVVAQRLADEKAKQKTFAAPRYNPLLRAFITEKFSEDWSPEQIAGFLRTQQSDLPVVSHETIYQMLYRGFVRREPKYRKTKVRKFRRRRLPKTPVNIDRKSISQRPDVINRRERFGDWEGDLVVGKNGRGAILTLVERKSGYLLAGLLSSKSSDEFKRMIRDLFAPYDNDILLSVTYDNGSEATDYRNIEQILQCDLYFANPGSPWQRGTNENTNGLLRRYLPKGTDFRYLDQNQLDVLLEYLNRRPRKRLNYRTPEAVFNEAIVALAA